MSGEFHEGQWFLERRFAPGQGFVTGSKGSGNTPFIHGKGSGDHCTMGAPTTGGSINEVGWRFQPFRINDLEMVDQMFASWNRIASWLRQIDGLQ
jgi:hypothetical protein